MVHKGQIRKPTCADYEENKQEPKQVFLRLGVSFVIEIYLHASSQSTVFLKAENLAANQWENEYDEEGDEYPEEGLP